MKIDIIGAVGSGKTTLSHNIAEEFNISCYEQDNIVWMRTNEGDIMRPDEERERMFMDILTSENWVMEGSRVKNTKDAINFCYNTYKIK